MPLMWRMREYDGCQPAHSIEFAQRRKAGSVNIKGVVVIGCGCPRTESLP